MNLAIASPSASAYSETFITMQMERLPCVFRIHGRPIASETVPGGPIEPTRCLRGLLDTAVEIGRRGDRRQGARVREFERRLRKARITTILANYGPTGVGLMSTCRRLGISLVVHFHGYDAHNLAVLKKQQSGYRELGKTASAVIAVSNAMVESLVVNGIPREKISLLRCGVDETRFPAKSDFPTDPLFFAVGRFTDKKAPYLTLLAFKQVLEAHPNARLIMAGEGELWETTRNLSAALDIDFAVSFPGVITPEEVSSWMGRATAFVQHSIAPLYGPSAGDSEGTPVAVLEALVSGLPVISTRHTGIGDVVDNGQSGFLVDERDVDGMAAAMVRLCGSREEAITMGARARKDALSKYTASHYIDSLRQVLQRCGTADIE